MECYFRSLRYFLDTHPAKPFSPPHMTSMQTKGCSDRIILTSIPSTNCPSLSDFELLSLRTFSQVTQENGIDIDACQRTIRQETTSQRLEVIKSKGSMSIGSITTGISVHQLGKKTHVVDHTNWHKSLPIFSSSSSARTLISSQDDVVPLSRGFWYC